MLTIKILAENLPVREMDHHLDQILLTLMKKAADTNVFISESGD